MKNNGTMKESVVHSIAQIKNYFFMLKILTYESDTFLQSLNYYLLRLLHIKNNTFYDFIDTTSSEICIF